MQSPKISKISRRSFLQITAGVAALTGISMPTTAQAGSDKPLSTLIDLSLCDGCVDRETPACVGACRRINKDKIPKVVDSIPEPWPRKTIEDWSKKQDVTNRLTPYNFIYVHKAEIVSGWPPTDHLRPEALHALRQSRLRDHLPVFRQP